MSKYEKATQPTMYFIGVTTGSSSIMRVFPKWAEALGLKDAVIKGMDFKPHSDPAEYREAVDLLKTIPFLWVRLLPPTRSICTMPARICSNIWIPSQPS